MKGEKKGRFWQKAIGLAGVFLFLAAFFLPSRVLAQTGAGFSVSPPTFEMAANPGDVLANTVRVENLSDTATTISVDRRNFTALGEEGAVGLTEEETSFSLASWISVEPEVATIPPRQSHTFRFTISVPQNAEPGGHFGSLVFKTGGAKPEQTGAALAQEVAALVLLRVAGKTEEAASLAGFSTKNFWEYGPVDFEIRVKNEGNVHLRPTGTITITNIFGQKVADLVVEPRNVLPGAVRKSVVSWPEKNLAGKYTATLYLTYGNQGKTLTASTTFFAFPYKVGGLILIALLAAGFLIWKGRRRIKAAFQVLFKGK